MRDKVVKSILRYIKHSKDMVWLEAQIGNQLQHLEWEVVGRERERIHKQIATIAKYDMVDDNSKLAFKWLLMELESQDHKESLKPTSKRCCDGHSYLCGTGVGKWLCCLKCPNTPKENNETK